MNLPIRGTAILDAIGEEGDPNWQNVQRRDVPKHLRQRYWINKWSGSRWPSSEFIHGRGKAEIPLAKLGRKPDDPGDAFFYLFHVTSEWFVWARTWVEVTEVFFPGEGKNVDDFMRQRNGLLGRSQIDTQEFQNRLDFGLPDVRLQQDMADRVIEAVKKKAIKGREGGSYHRLVKEYGRGVLIVGLPLWFAVFPSVPEDPTGAIKDFGIRVGLGLQAMEHFVLRTSWCPFDSIEILWTPTAEALNAWAGNADAGFYNDPANLSLRHPVSLLKLHAMMDSVYKVAGKFGASQPEFVTHAKWNRYGSVDAMLADQFRRIRLFRGPLPMGPKSDFVVSRNEGHSSWKSDLLSKAFPVWVFIRVHGWQGIRRRILARLSPGRLYSRWKLRRQAKKLYGRSRCNAGNRIT